MSPVSVAITITVSAHPPAILSAFGFLAEPFLGQLQWTSYLTSHPSFKVPKQKKLLQPNSYMPPE
jgi:hypothetical protein